MEKENTTWIRPPLNMEKIRRFQGVLMYIVKKTRIPKSGEEEDVGFPSCRKEKCPPSFLPPSPWNTAGQCVINLSIKIYHKT